MIKMLATLLAPILHLPIVKRVRRNHGLEHATIHMLNKQNYILSGRASLNGFVIMGDVPQEKVEAAAHEALRRLREGQSRLAIHPNCGTNLVTGGLLTTTIALAGFTNTNRKSAWERFPIVMIMMMGAAFYSQPIGMMVQEHITTLGDPGDMIIVTIKRKEMSVPFRDSTIPMHEVVTRYG